MNILELNSMPVGSTGKIMFEIGEYMQSQGHVVKYAFPEFDAKCPKEYKNRTIIIGNKIMLSLAHVLGRLTGYNDYFLNFSTIKFLDKIDKLELDIIHIHNLHNCYVNYDLLFDYLQKRKIKIVWTLHDCWSFTGGCPYFARIECDKWKTECQKCELINRYPKMYIDRTKEQYYRKKKIYSNNNIVFVTPSCWIKNLAEHSFLNKHEFHVIHNGINLDIFKPDLTKVVKKKIIILGVAFKWDKRKGLDTFIQLSKLLDDHYQIVLVGVCDKDKKKIPNGIVTIARTKNIVELVEYYNMADIFVNPTLEDNYPTTNIEAIACGTPVITYETGGSPEAILEGTGIIVKEKNVTGILDAIDKMTKDLEYYRQNCISKAKEYGMEKMCKKYYEVFQKLIDEEL